MRTADRRKGGVDTACPKNVVTIGLAVMSMKVVNTGVR
jgi:hypothetical protein